MLHAHADAEVTMNCIRLIGETQVRTPERVCSGRDFGGVKPRQLLEVLALHLGTSVSKERLADLLWEGQPPGSWGPTLEGYVSQLRRVLEPGVPARTSMIRTVSGGYALDPDRVEVDSCTVRHLVAQASAARPGVALPLLRQALETASHELLVSSSGTAWAAAARREHLLVCVDAATNAAQHALHLGQPDLATVLADRALALDPMAEEACRRAMQGLWASGRTAEALRRYSELRTVLADELGVDPTAQTRSLLSRLLKDEAPPRMPFERRRTDRPLALAGASERSVDVLTGAVVMALRRTSAATVYDDDPELLAKLEDVLRYLHGDVVPEHLNSAAS
jgi:DNA-binding SARP family transcriptional activator